jgi:hypothetical protein
VAAHWGASCWTRKAALIIIQISAAVSVHREGAYVYCMSATEEIDFLALPMGFDLIV